MIMCLYVRPYYYLDDLFGQIHPLDKQSEITNVKYPSGHTACGNPAAYIEIETDVTIAIANARSVANNKYEL